MQSAVTTKEVQDLISRYLSKAVVDVTVLMGKIFEEEFYRFNALHRLNNTVLDQGRPNNKQARLGHFFEAPECNETRHE